MFDSAGGLVDGSYFGSQSCLVQLIWPVFGKPGEPGSRPPVIVSTTRWCDLIVQLGVILSMALLSSLDVSFSSRAISAVKPFSVEQRCCALLAHHNQALQLLSAWCMAELLGCGGMLNQQCAHRPRCNLGILLVDVVPFQIFCCANTHAVWHPPASTFFISCCC